MEAKGVIDPEIIDSTFWHDKFPRSIFLHVGSGNAKGRIINMSALVNGDNSPAITSVLILPPGAQLARDGDGSAGLRIASSTSAPGEEDRKQNSNRNRDKAFHHGAPFS
jgi:hypothetical protein